MNGAHLHLMVNHAPVFAVAFGLAALVWAMIRGSSEMRWAAILLFVVAAVGAFVSAVSGEAAVDVVERLPGVTKELIHDHEEAGEAAAVMVGLLAVVGVAVGWVSRFRSHLLKKAQGVLLLVALVAAATLFRAAFFGGQVRHTEIREDASSAR